MASDSNRNNDSNTSSQKPDVFIKFRQFADAQIGSLLQGIIGLPSAFSKNPAANAQWADFDDDLRRRDELKLRQKQLIDSETLRSFQHPSKEGGEPPMKQWPEHPDSSNIPRQMDEQEARDLPLFSPTSKHHFRHLDRGGDDGKDWDPKSLIGNRFIPDYFPWPLRFEQQSSDAMRNTQHCMYNELNGQPFFRSQYSLLPFILFSPYSPLKLELDQRSHYHRAGVDTFPYCSAFEDLIATTNESQCSGPNGYLGCSTMNRLPLRGVGWIGYLHNIGLLQQKEAHSVHSMIDWPYPGHLARQIDSNPETELEVYERFLSSPERIPETIFSLLEKAEGFVEKQFKVYNTPEGKQAVQDFLESKLAKELFGGQEGTESPGAAKRQSDSEWDARKVTLDEERRESQDALPPTIATSKSGQDANKVVATSTTSERNVEEDGSVETTVCVWKRFVNGRESTTTTTHYESSNGVHESEEEMQETNSEEPKQTKENKGWFWN